MVHRDIFGLTDIVNQLVELSAFEFSLLVRRRFAAGAARFATERSVRVRELELPAAIAADDGLELVNFIIKPVAHMRIFGAALSGDDRPHIQSIDSVIREPRANEVSDGWK